MGNSKVFVNDATMLPTASVNALLAVVVIVAFAYFSYRWWDVHPMYGRNKGPKVYPVVGSTIPFLLNRHRVLEYHTDLLRNAACGAIYTIRGVRPIHQCSYITTDPRNIEYILKTKLGNFPKGEFINQHLRSIVGDGIFNADDHLWKVERQVASREFTTRSLTDFWLETAHAETNERLLPILSAASQSGRSLDVQDVLSRFAFDTICQQGFGVHPACLSVDLPSVKFAEAFDTAMQVIFKRSQSLSQWVWALKVALDVGDAKKLRLALPVIDEFALEVIENRKNELQALAGAESMAESADDHDEGGRRFRGGRSDLLSRFMTMVNVVDDEEEDGTNEKISISSCGRGVTAARAGVVISKPLNVFLRDMIISFILAGRDTSTAALSWFFWLLAMHPDVESAILGEISAVHHSRRSSDSNDQDDPQDINFDFSLQELKDMHYLTASLMESMRLYPPVPFDFKSVRRSDVLPDGTKVVAGSIVGYHSFAMGRMEHLWGKDCLSFRPGRWLDDDGAFVPASPFKYPIFNAGPRICMGKEVAMMQMKAICVAVLKNFKLEVSPDFKPEYLLTMTLRLKHGLPMKVQRRNAYVPVGVYSRTNS